MIKFLKKWFWNKGALWAVALTVIFYAHGFLFAYGFWEFIKCCTKLAGVSDE